MPRADASETLLDAAERLFAEQGFSSISDRRIAEAAGNGNHSAVRYYFGGRPGLLEALVERHHVQVQPLRRTMQAESGSLTDDVRAMVMPQIRTFDALGVPSWRARFLATAYVDPQTQGVIRRLGHDPVTGGTVLDAVRSRLAGLDQQIVLRRAEMMGYMVVSACARLEEREAHGEQVSWEVAGWFLSDAIAGMLQAPISEPPAGWRVD